MRRDAPPARDARDTATLALLACEAATTRCYGRDEFELLVALREPAPALIDTRSRPRSRWRRGDTGAIAAGLATVLAMSALGAYALASTLPQDPSPTPSPTPSPNQEKNLSRQGAKAPQERSSDPLAPWRLGGLNPNPSPSPNPTPGAVIDLLARGSYDDALHGYERLARAEPTQPAYAAAAAVLRSKLAAQCTSHDGAQRPPCPVAEP